MLGKLKYGSSETKRLSPKELDQEYQNRLHGVASVVTRMYPTLSSRDGMPQIQYPIFFIETREINSAVAKIHKLSKKIEYLTLNDEYLPLIAQISFTNFLLTNEIYYTNQIEDVETSREQISTIIQRNSNLPSENRIESTIRLYKNTVAGGVYEIRSLNDIRMIYEILLDGEMDASKLPDGGLFRNSSVYIGTDNKVAFLPPSNEKEIRKALIQLIDFMNQDELDPSIKAIVTHYMFENTHPFLDGNGRTGRFLLSTYLANKFDIFTGLSISTAIHAHTKTYYQIFKHVNQLDNRAELTAFIQSMLGIILWGQNYVLQQLRKRQKQLKTELHSIRKMIPDLSHLEDEILHLILISDLFSGWQSSGIQDRQVVTILNKQNHPSFSIKEIKNGIEGLTKKGILIEIYERPKQHIISASLKSSDTSFK